MGANLFTPEDLEMALDRVLNEHTRNSVFVTSAPQLALIRECRSRWIERLGAAVNEGQYSPSPSQIVDVPKSYAAVRPGMLLTLEDQVVYTACVGKAASAIVAATSWAKPPRDFAYRIRDPKQRDWITYSYVCWKEFRRESTSALDAGAQLMVSADITAFYEHIAHEHLLSDLRGINVNEAIVGLIGTCLGRWAAINGRGIPQSCNPSHLLAKIYLNVVDRGLFDAGFSHARYVDDTRIFCADRAETKRALLYFTTALRRRGLSL
ncbi:MAG: hypothetical protein JWM95_1420, partial [Gemmatimonadetes bacterium]|nr:hypothetical protein [Gemmatimonadota bacterium]